LRAPKPSRWLLNEHIEAHGSNNHNTPKDLDRSPGLGIENVAPPLTGTTMNPNFRNFALWVIIFLLVVALIMLFQNPGQRIPSRDISFSQLLNEVDQGHVREVTIAGSEITGHFTDNRAFSTYAPNDPNLVQTLRAKNISITAKPPSEGTSWLMSILVNSLPLVAIIAIWIIFSRQMQGPGGKAMGFGKSKARCSRRPRAA
jgi:cell division protease FtsH